MKEENTSPFSMQAYTSTFDAVYTNQRHVQSRHWLGTRLSLCWKDTFLPASHVEVTVEHPLSNFLALHPPWKL